MPVTTHDIANVGSPADDPTCVLPGTLYIPDPFLHPQPWNCVVGTEANTFTGNNALADLAPIFTELAGEGFLCLAHYVRLVNPIATQTTDGKWHQQTDDLKIGVRYMRSNPGSLGYSVTGKVASFGGSSSAGHALYMALDGTAGDDKSDAALCLSPVCDMGGSPEDNHFTTTCATYARTSVAATMTARSPIALNLAAAKPIRHYNGDNENMPVSQWNLFKAAMLAASAVGYVAIKNTGLLGRQHSWDMWPGVNTESIAWLKTAMGVALPTPLLLTSASSGLSGQYQKHFIGS